MPTETFFNLPLEKKNKIIEAIKKEFARVPFEEVSINKIIQDANISRGSFYMYFEDKKDMLIYVLSSYRDKIDSLIEESFKQNKGDIFEVFNDILNFTDNFGTAKENIAFCMNIFSNQKIHNEILLHFGSPSRKNEYFDLFRKHTDTKNFNLQSSNDLDDIIDILMSLTQKSTVDIFLYIEEKDEILKEYKNKITIIKRGILKEKL